MILRTFRTLFHFAGGLAAGLAIMLVLLAWRLSAGPISLGFLSSHVGDMIDLGTQVQVGDTILTWAGWERTLDIRVLDVRALAADGSVVARVPEASVSLSARALVAGTVAPKRIDLFHPTLRLVRRPDGRLELGIGTATAEDLLRSFLAAVAVPTEPGHALAYLDRITVVDGDLTIEDRQSETLWQAPDSQIRFQRTAEGMTAEGALELKLPDETTRLRVAADYRHAVGRLEVDVRFEPVTPASLADMTSALAPLAALRLPVRGNVRFGMNLDGTVQQMGFDLEGAAGAIALPVPLEQTLGVRTASIKGSVSGHEGVVEIDDLVLDLAQDAALMLPQAAGHQVPLRRLTARGRYSTVSGRLEVAALEADLGGPTVSLSGTVEGSATAPSGTMRGVLRQVPTGDLTRYWPRTWGADVREWCLANLAEGLLREARAEIAFGPTSGGGVGITQISGAMAADGLSVTYLPTLPAARGVSATMTFDRRRFDVRIQGGAVGGLKVRGGQVRFTGLDQVDQFADVDLAIAGPLRDAVVLLDRPPLGFAAAVGLDPAGTGGRTSTRLKFKFMVERNMDPTAIQVAAAATLEDVSAARIIAGRDLAHGALELKLDNRRMTVAGTALVGEIPIHLTWEQVFAPADGVRGRYRIAGRVAEGQWSRSLGLDFAPFTGGMLNGPTDAEVTVQALDGGRLRIQAALDLTQARLHLDRLFWLKPEGQPGSAEIELEFEGDRLRDVPRFRVRAEDLNVRGSAAITPATGALAQITFSRLAYGRTDVAGTLAPRTDGDWDADFRGPSFDLEPLLEDLSRGTELSGDFAAGTEEDRPRFSLEARIDRLWLGPDRSLTGVKASLGGGHRRLTRLNLHGLLAGGKGFEIRMAPAEEGGRKVDIAADDAGEALHAFGLYDNMIGGALNIAGAIDDLRPSAPFRGRLSVKDYRVTKAPVLTRVLSVMALTGIVEALNGPGLSFSILDVPFTLEGGVLDVVDSRASGPSLGFTATGRFFVPMDRMDVEGTVVPAYAINSLLGRVPVIGGLFSAEKGGGVFAATYKMTGSIEVPEVAVNPLSALAPGLLRRLFGIFEGGKEEPKPDDGSPTPIIPQRSP